MTLTVFHYPGCSTCKKALAWLRANGIEFTAVDIVKNPPTNAQLEAAQKLANVPVKKLFNVAGASYRDGDFKTKLSTMSVAQAIDALANDGKLIKRPLAITSNRALVGFDEKTWKMALT